MVYLYIIVALAFAAVSGYAAIEHSGKQAAQAEVAQRDAQIAQHNAAIAATKADGERRVAEASKGVARASQATAQARTEAQRLRDALAAATPAGACPAGQGVAELRKGLK